MPIRRRRPKQTIDDLRRGSAATVLGWDEELAGEPGIGAHGSDDDTPVPTRKQDPVAPEPEPEGADEDDEAD